MNQYQILSISSIALLILGVIMIYLGGFQSPDVIWPPVVTGIGFFVIALVFNVLKPTKEDE